MIAFFKLLTIKSYSSPGSVVVERRLLFPDETTRINNLDFIRFILALSVLYCHCFVLYYGTEDTVEPLWVVSNKQLSLGTLSVNFFFTISGFLVLQSWNNSKGFGDYIRKRIIRIYPGFIVASLLCILVFAPLGTADWYMPWGYWKLYYQSLSVPKALLSVAELTQPWVPWTLKYVPIPEAINGSLWTIRYEFYCYLVVPLFALIGIYKKRLLVIFLFLIAYVYQGLQSYYNIYLFGWQEFPIIGKPDFFPRFLTYFIVGMCFYCYKDVIPRSKTFLAISILMMVLSTVAFKGLALTQPIFGSYILFYLAFTTSISFKNFSRKGDFSYGLYMYAWPVQQLIILYMEKYLNLSLLFILTFIITMIFAYLSWHYIEQPFLSFKKRRQ